MIEIYLIRHGQASFGADNYDRLSASGIEQSRLLGRWLQDQGLRFDAIVSGERERQRHTALHAFADTEHSVPALRIDPSFNEIDAERLLRHAVPFKVLREPSLAPMLLNLNGNKDAFRRIFIRVIDEWVEGQWAGAGIGDWVSFSNRVIGAIGTLAAAAGEPRRIAVFTSGGPITAAIRRFGSDGGQGLDWRIANTSITRIIRPASGEWQIIERGSLPHLSERPDLVTHL